MLTIKSLTTYLKRRPFIQFFFKVKNITTLTTIRFLIDGFSSSLVEYFIILKKNVFITHFFGVENVHYVLKEQFFYYKYLMIVVS